MKEMKEEGDCSKMVDILRGCRFNQADLCIFMGGYERLEGSHLNALLQESLRGMIMIGDLHRLASSSPEWMNFISWANGQNDGKQESQEHQDKGYPVDGRRQISQARSQSRSCSSTSRRMSSGTAIASAWSSPQ